MNAPADPIFRAISDPTRRKILDLLSESECSVKKLTESFTISQPAVSQHLRELRASKLVASQKVGIEQRYRLTAGPLREVFGWVSRYRMLFDPSGHAWTFATSASGVEGKTNKKGKTRGR